MFKLRKNSKDYISRSKQFIFFFLIYILKNPGGFLELDKYKCEKINNFEMKTSKRQNIKYNIIDYIRT